MNLNRKAIEDLKQKQSDYKKVFDSDAGKRVLDDLQRRGFLHTTTFAENELKMAYREGMRSMALHIKTMLEYDFEQVKKRIKEAENG